MRVLGKESVTVEIEEFLVKELEPLLSGIKNGEHACRF